MYKRGGRRMLGQSVTEEYITNIPWNLNPGFCFADTEEAYEEAFKSVIEFVPNTNERIRYDEDIWDFRPFFKDINSDSYVMRFSSANSDYVDYLKFFVIYGISRKSKISTVERRIGDFIQVINEVKNRTNHKSFSLITTEDISNVIEDKDITNSRKSSLYVCSHLIYEFIIKNYNLDIPIDIETLKEGASKYHKKARTEDDKLPNIPEDFYTIIRNKAYEILNDEAASFNTRMTAGMIIIATQTGLRRQDLLGIKKDALKEKRLPISNVKCHYLHFQTRKPSKAHSDMLEFDIFASELCSDAFNKMLEIRERCEFKDQPYLYILDKKRNSANTYPITETRFVNEYNRFFYEHLNSEIQKEREGISPVKYQSKTNGIKINIPSISQYRVHLATSLYNNGISLVYIQRYLGHLSEYMLGYYVRPKDTGPENAKYAERIVKKIVNDDGTPLGHMGKELKQNLINFIEDGEYNVATDTKAIIDDLGEKLVIREKGSGLCCIKTSIIPCKHDARTNETLCAYGLCPNIFHFYDMIDVTYMQFHALQDSYQENLNNGFTRAAQKELNKIKDFIRRRFRPEADELKRIIKKHGLENFCLEHPDLRNIATSIDDIYKEIELWENY